MIIILILIILGIVIFHKFFKIPKFGNLCLVTGGVKTGKTLLSLHFAIKTYKKQVRNTKIINWFRVKIFKKQALKLPLFYSNIPVGIDYVKVTKDLLSLKSKVVKGSVMFIDEASLFADSQLIQDKDVNTNLLLFNKLCAHFGLSLLMYNTQCIQDVHYTIKRSLSNYFYIHHTHKCLLLPFVILHLQEYRYSDDGSVIAITGQEDLEKQLKRVIITKSTFKKYDSHCYYKIVENLPTEENIIKSSKKDDLTCDEIISFRDDFSKLLNKKKKVDVHILNQTGFDEIEKFKIKMGVYNNEKN